MEGQEIQVSVKVTPSSKREEVKEGGERLLVKVKEPPREGRANEAVIKLVAEHFGVSSKSVRIVSGHRSRNKTLVISLGS